MDRSGHDKVAGTKAFINTLGEGGRVCFVVTDDVRRGCLKHRVKIAMSGVIDNSAFRTRRCARFTNSEARPEHNIVQRHFFKDLASRPRNWGGMEKSSKTSYPERAKGMAAAVIARRIT